MNDIELMQHEWALRKLAMDYARAADRRDGPAFAALFTPDGVIEGGGPLRLVGHEQLLAIPGMLNQLYQSTMHGVQTHAATIDGDTAEGETYCIAHHISRPQNGVITRLTWAIRYQDNYARQSGKWLYARRRLLVDWTERTPVTLMDWAEASASASQNL